MLHAPRRAARRCTGLLALLVAAPCLAQGPSFADTPDALRTATASALAAGDSVTAARTLTWRSIKTTDPNLALQAIRMVGARGSRGDQILALLAGEYSARLRGRPADADTLLAILCRSSCATISPDPDDLAQRLVAELGRHADAGRGPIASAVVALIARADLAGRDAELRAMTWFTGTLPTEIALRDVQRAGRVDDERALRLALAYAALPDRPVPVGGGRDALVHARAALALAPERDSLVRSRIAGVLALAHLRAGAPDSARLYATRAERWGASAPVAERATQRRRVAVIAAAAGDTASLRPALADAIALRGDQALPIAFDRLRVARELTGADQHPALALTLARAAWATLRDAPPAQRSDAAVGLAEAYRATGALDSAAAYFDSAASTLAQSGAQAAAVEAFAAAAEARFERGDVAAAIATVERSQALLLAWPWDRTVAAHRVLNDVLMLALADGATAQALQLLAQVPAGLPGPPERAETERIAALLRLATAPVDSLGPGTPMRREALRVYVDEKQEPARARRRPHSDALWALHAAELQLLRGELGAAYASSREAIALAEQTSHPRTRAQARAVMATLFAVAGRDDSAAVYRTGIAGALPSRPADRLVLTPDSLRALQRLAPSAERAALEARLADAQRVRARLSEAWIAAALAEHHLRRATPRRADLATAYYDSAAAALRAVDQANLPDWYRIQFAERVRAVQEQSVLAWLARSDALGATPAAMAALAAADRMRGDAFNLMTGAGYRAGGLANQVFRGVLQGNSLVEAGENLLMPAFRYGSGPHMLVFHQTSDTLVRWLRVPHPDGSGRLGTRALWVSRVAISADSLTALVTRARNALGVDSAGTRSLAQLEPAGVARARGVVAAVRPSADASAELRALAAVLLPTELAAALAPGTELVIVASGSLASVPFAALPMDSSGAPLSSAAALRYVPSLLWRVANASAATALPRNVRRDLLTDKPSEDAATRAQRAAWLRSAVVVGNPTMPTVAFGGTAPTRLSPLPGAEREARDVAARLGVQPMLGDAASLGALRTRAASATVLHFATHGFAYGAEADVGHSFLALAPARGDDGLLTVDEMLAGGALDLRRTNLVVLSACQTGLGQLTASEGTLGLQRAFLAAGAASVLVSLWSVSDEATAALLESFYRHWLGNLSDASKAEALRRAQEELRADPRFRHPRYWAAFQLVGEEAGDPTAR